MGFIIESNEKIQHERSFMGDLLAKNHQKSVLRRDFKSVAAGAIWLEIGEMVVLDLMNFSR
jgi:hypothetical protein